MFLSNGALVSTKTPIFAGNSSQWPSISGLSSSVWPSGYSSMFRKQLWVYVVVMKLARAEARLPLPVYRRDEKGRTKVPDHPMARLLDEPNPGMSGMALRTWTAATQGIYGEAVWWKRRVGGVVVELYPLHPTKLSYNRDSKSWDFDPGTGTRILDIPDTDLVFFRSYDPDSLTRGLSPLEPLRATLENEWHARSATDSFWRSGARPGMFLMHEKNLSDAALRRLRAQVDEVSGGSSSTGRTMILEEGMTPHTATLTAEEAQYIETRKLNREEVCAAYDVPPPVVHILDRATFSNITEQMRSMYRDTMAPRLGEREAEIEMQLRRVEWPNDDVYAEHLMDEVLRGDFESRQEALSKAAHMTIAEKRVVENLPFIEGTDRIFLNTATMPLDAIDAQAQAIADQVANSADPVADVIPLSVARSVMGRLSYQKTLDEVDAEALVVDLNGSAGAVLKALAAETAAGGDVPGLRERIRALVKE